MDKGLSIQEWGAPNMERVACCIALLKELSVRTLSDDGPQARHLVDVLHLTQARSYLIAYAIHRESGLDHEAALRMLTLLPLAT